MLSPEQRTAEVSALRAQLDCVQTSIAPVLPFGVRELDEALFAGGLGGDALHEVAPASPALTDDAAATLFAAGAAARFAGSAEGTVLWVATRFDLYAPGLEQAGLRTARLLFGEARDDAQVLALAEDGLRHGALAAVVAEVRKVSMIATRRLQLAAADGGTPALLIRRWKRRAECPLAEPSSATTRWRVGSAPSVPLGLPGVGRSSWNVELVRQRNGAPFSLVLEACDDQGRLALSTIACDRADTGERATARAA